MAIQTFARAIGISPSSPEAFYNLGYVLFSVGDIERARNAFEKAIHYNASYAEAYHNLGIICQETGDTAGAVLNFQKGARLGFEGSQKVLRTRGLSW